MVWGRTTTPNIVSRTVMSGLFLFAPAICMIFAVTNIKHDGSFEKLWNDFTWGDFAVLTKDKWIAAKILFGWFSFQWVLALLPDICSRYIPNYIGGEQWGQRTPSGRILKYNINGLQAWIITHVLFLLGIYRGYQFTWVVYHWLAIFFAANMIGYTLTLLAYIKAKIFPTHPKDNKETGYSWYDMIMDIEFNPRFFGFDFKLFFNGRPGIIGWSILNLCFMLVQYERFGMVTNAMVLLTFLQGVYILDFFWYESWYLKTIDIAHEHFGFYLAWGDCVWLPFMYTLQGYYLAHHPVVLHPLAAVAIFTIGMLGYTIFRSANNQKVFFRKMMAYKDRLTDITEEFFMQQYVLIWNKPASYITCRYETTDKKMRTSYLLTSGFWGLARHMNYVGDIILSTMWCMCCGLTHLLPHFYTFYIIALLVTRTFRDETRCRGKYGDEKWDEYCKRVPYRFIPYIY